MNVNTLPENVCPYCEEEFEDEEEKGVHISKNHVDTDSKITKPKRQHDARINMMDQWVGGGEEEA